MSRFEKIRDYITNDISDEDIVKLHNYFCDSTNRFDDKIYDMGDFDDEMQYETPWNIASKIWNGDFNPNHDYWKFDGYANFKSFYSAYNVVQSEIYIDEIAEYVDENDDELYNEDLREILDNYQEDKEDEEE